MFSMRLLASDQHWVPKEEIVQAVSATKTALKTYGRQSPDFRKVAYECYGTYLEEAEHSRADDEEYYDQLFSPPLMDALDKAFLRHFPAKTAWAFGTTTETGETEDRYVAYLEEVTALLSAHESMAALKRSPNPGLSKTAALAAEKCRLIRAEFNQRAFPLPLLSVGFIDALWAKFKTIQWAFSEVRLPSQDVKS